MNPLLTRWRTRLGDRRLHEFLWFCVPAVLAGFAVRCALMTGLPYAHYHYDTPDFLQTPFTLLEQHRLTLHAKKTFLTPLLYTLPFLLRLPALVVIPLGQHALGLLLVLMAGGLCRLWFTAWRWFIVPLTTLTAIHPALLWHEHTLLAESHYVFCVVWLALAGTLFVLRPRGWEAFGFLLAALFFTAGARPEGRLFLAFGVLLTLLVYWGNWRGEFRKLAAMAGFCAVVMLLTRTSQAGVLLYASILHLSPDHLRAAPDLAPVIEPLVAERRQARSLAVPNDVVRTEKQLQKLILDDYLPAHPGLHLDTPRQMNSFCLKLAVETALAHPWSLPGIVVDKFRARIDDDSGGRFDSYDLLARQARSYWRGAERNTALGLTREPIATQEEIDGFVARHYQEKRVHWFNRLEAAWMHAVTRLRLPGAPYGPNYRLPGVPCFYLAALAGALAALLAPAHLRKFQWAFLPVLTGVWFSVTLTGALMPRYRFVLEPFWLLYFFFFADSLVRLGAWLARKRPALRAGPPPGSRAAAPALTTTTAA